jgi:uncharacterized damage-inducible protein DinB
MTPAELLVDSLNRVAEGITDLLDGLDEETAARRPAPGANSIAWLVWHLARVQDDHLAHAAGSAQVWTSDGFHERFGLPLDISDTGYGHTSEQVGSVVVAPRLLAAYAAAVHARSVGWISGLTPDDLDRVVDTRWDPPVTLGVRLVSVVNDCVQHLGQASYAKGLLST